MIIILKFTLLLIFLIAATTVCNGARILVYIGGVSSHSHRTAIQPLANKLAERGHEVTILSPFENSGSDPRIKEFRPAEVLAFNEILRNNYGVVGLKARLKEKFANDFLTGTTFFDAAHLSCSAVLSSPQLKPWMASAKFDLVIIDACANECAFALAHIFRAKTVLFNPTSTFMPWDADLFGLPSESSWLPAADLNYEGAWGFRERFENVLSSLYWGWKYGSYYLPRIENVVRETLGKEMKKEFPPLLELVRNASVYLINQHVSDQFARSIPPFAVAVGGIDVQDQRKPLPPEIESFIKTNGNEGFIYISFGSVVKISAVPPTIIKSFFDAFEAVKLPVLWKWEGEPPEDAPKNIYFKSWFPQQDILGHPKIKVFIMQGGQNSFQQGICNGVPIIIFPVNGDQDLVAKRVRHNRNGIEMEFANLTAISLQNSIEKLVQDPSYSREARKLAKICKDRPMSSVDTAVWWTEYTLRMDDTSHLKPLSIQQNGLVYRSLDVFGVIFFAVYVALTLLVVLVFKIYKCTSASSSSSKKTKRH